MKAEELLTFKLCDDVERAVVRVFTQRRSGIRTSPFLTGKFCEHLYRNIYNGMCAQVLRNPTFGSFPFGDGAHPDGGLKLECDEEKIAQMILRRARHTCLPDGEKLVESRREGLAT